MGMFNIIKTKKGCPSCGRGVEWQSKHLTYDGFVLDNLLQEVKLNKHVDGEMHTYCEKCGSSVEVTIKKGEDKGVKPRRYNDTKESEIVKAQETGNTTVMEKDNEQNF